MRRWLPLAGLAFVTLFLARPAAGALPPRHGGRITLPAPGAIDRLDPSEIHTHMDATLTDAVFDRLYAPNRRGGGVRPVLAAGAPEVAGHVATIHLRPGARHHGGRPLTAAQVVASLLRAHDSTQGRWLFGAFRDHGQGPILRAVDADTLEIELARPWVRAEYLLAARPLAITVSTDPRRPVGTGPYRVRSLSGGRVRLRLFRGAPDGAPWLNNIELQPPRTRSDEIRAFELGEIDASWQGASLYGGRPVRPVTTLRSTRGAPVVLIPNRRGRLNRDSAWGSVAAAIDRQRLERTGLSANDRLRSSLPAPTLPRPDSRTRRLTLRMIVRRNHPLEVRLGAAIAAMLDERGIRLTVRSLSEGAHASALRRGDWDLRLESVRPPFPGRGALVGAALAACGEEQRARDLALHLGNAQRAADQVRNLGAMVLGHERLVLHHRADLLGLTIGAYGRLPLARLSLARPAVNLR